jgi:hypothetical protein
MKFSDILFIYRSLLDMASKAIPLEEVLRWQNDAETGDDLIGMHSAVGKWNGR